MSIDNEPEGRSDGGEHAVNPVQHVNVSVSRGVLSMHHEH